jgi:2-methylcitrate dehydratase PrpD
MPNALIYALPQTALEAKFSFPFFLAIAILRRKVGIEEFTDEVVRSPEVQAMMRRCRHVVDPEIDARGFQHLDTRIEIRLRDGRVLARSERYATGHPRKPMSAEQLEEKFLDCARLALDDEQARRAAELIRKLPSLPAIGPVHDALSGSPPG